MSWRPYREEISVSENIRTINSKTIDNDTITDKFRY